MGRHVWYVTMMSSMSSKRLVLAKGFSRSRRQVKLEKYVKSSPTHLGSLRGEERQRVGHSEGRDWRDICQRPVV